MIQQLNDILCQGFGYESITDVACFLVACSYFGKFLKYLYSKVKGVFIDA